MNQAEKSLNNNFITMNKKQISIKSGIKLGFFSKLLLTVGILLIVATIILYYFPLLEDGKDIAGVLFAFSILSIGISVIFYFISSQFAKLAEIAEEVENCEDIK